MALQPTHAITKTTQEPQSEIGGEMSRLHSAINELDARVSVLLAQLSDYRTPHEGTRPAPPRESTNPEPASAHGKAIAECARKITEINDVLIEATRALAL